MPTDELKRLERKTFRAASDTGLWDLLLASIFAMFAIAPFLSPRLGDFWSSAVFLPFFGLVYLIIRVVHTRVVLPRVGFVEYGKERRARLQRLTRIMLAGNVVALAVGIYMLTRPNAGQGYLPVVAFSLILLLGFSLGAFYLNVPRLFFYGALAAVAPAVGEALFRRGFASHHGFPITFGLVSMIIVVCGLMRFRQVVLGRTPGSEALPGAEAR